VAARPPGQPRRGLLRDSAHSARGSSTKRKRPFWVESGRSQPRFLMTPSLQSRPLAALEKPRDLRHICGAS
jgi:hypothetical protein